MNKKIIPYLTLLVLGLLIFLVKSCGKNSEQHNKQVTQKTRGLNRNPSNINYTKHAKCRMDCRHIDEFEVRDILTNGTINYKKSDLQKDDCHKRYALEGYSKDKQHLRIIAVPCNDEITIITCIDIGVEWECHCEGDD